VAALLSLLQNAQHKPPLAGCYEFVYAASKTETVGKRNAKSIHTIAVTLMMIMIKQGNYTVRQKNCIVLFLP